MSVIAPPVETRIEICKYASAHGATAAEKKYGVRRSTIRAWRRALGFPPLKSGPRKK